MVFAKKLDLQSLFLFLYLVSFPFGLLLQLKFPLLTGYIAIYPTDIFAFLFILVGIYLYDFKKIYYKYKAFFAFFLVASFSFILSLFDLRFSVLPGLGYLVRLILYFGFWIYIAEFVKKDKHKKNLLFSSSYIITISVALLGWIQYLIYPDFRPFQEFGWDDHLYRLIGTFLDPGFTSIILCFGAMISFYKYLQQKNKVHLLFMLFFVMTLGFTYSRAGIIALLSTIFFVIFLNKKYKYFILLLLTLLFIPFLPKKIGEGTNLLRTYSINERIKNYQTGISIYKERLLFGVGYNNLCQLKVDANFYNKPDSHSCSGLDNSIIMILSTMGLVGFISFFNLIVKVLRETTVGLYGNLFFSASIVLFVHSQFNNSIFYPWVLGLLGIMFSISRRNYSE